MGEAKIVVEGIEVVVEAADRRGGVEADALEGDGRMGKAVEGRPPRNRAGSNAIARRAPGPANTSVVGDSSKGSGRIRGGVIGVGPALYPDRAVRSFPIHAERARRP